MRRLPGWPASSSVLCALLGAFAIAMGATSSSAAFQQAGPEFEVSASGWIGGYTGRSVAAMPDGGFIVTWWDVDPLASFTTDVFARRYDANGNAAGAPFQVNTYTTGSQLLAATAVAPDGSFLIVWESTAGSGGSDTSQSSVSARLFDSAAAPAGDDFQVNTYTTFSQSEPSVAAMGNSGFVVAWSGAADGGIAARRFDASAAPLGPEITVNASSTYQYKSTVAGTDDGFVVVWQSEGSPGDDTQYESILGRRFDTGGNALGSDFQVNTYTTGYQIKPVVTFDDAGRFLVAWSSNGDFNSLEIRARQFGVGGVPTGPDFQVNTYTTGDQDYAAVASRPNDGFVVAWSSEGGFGGDITDLSIQARTFDANGVPDGPEFQVNSTHPEDQQAPQIDGDASGNFVVAWNRPGVRAQRFVDAVAVQSCGPSSCSFGGAVGNAPSSTAGSASVSIPAGALPAPTELRMVERSDSDFSLQTPASKIVLIADFLPHGQTFAQPVTMTFTWNANAGNAARVDDVNDLDTAIYERDLAVWHNGCQITRTCQPSGGACIASLASTPECAGQTPATNCSCNLAANTITFQVSSFSEFVLAGAGGIPVVPTKLVMVDKVATAGSAKAVFVAKDAGITKGAGTSTGAIAATLDIAFDSTHAQYDMPAGSGWLVNRSTVAKYVNDQAPAGGAVKVSVVKPGRLAKVVGKSLGDTPIDISVAPTGPVYVAHTIVNETETFQHCGRFDGCVHKTIAGGTGYKLVCKGNASGDPNCAAVP